MILNMAIALAKVWDLADSKDVRIWDFYFLGCEWCDLRFHECECDDFCTYCDLHYNLCYCPE